MPTSALFREILIQYVEDNEDEFIIGNRRLIEILKNGGTGTFEQEKESGFGIFKKITKIQTQYDRYEWDLINYKSLIEKYSDRIYCVIDDGIFFMDNGFTFKNELSEGMTLFDLVDFVTAEIRDSDLCFYLSLPDYEDKDGMCPEMIFDGMDTAKANSVKQHILNIITLFNKAIENERKQELETRRDQIIDEVSTEDKEAVALESSLDFETILKESQQKIIQIDRNYIQKFVKVSNFLKQKNININKIFELAKEVDYKNELEKCYMLLNQEKYVYDSVLFHSFGMISSLLDDDMITFYEIYESFDKLSIFNTNWENETAERLSNIESGIDSANQVLLNILQQSINMEKNIINSINDMSYMTNKSITAMTSSMSSHLNRIGSQLRINNLLTGIQTYQSYKSHQRLR